MSTADVSGTIELIFEDINMADNFGNPIVVTVTAEISYEGHTDSREPFNDDMEWSIERLYDMTIYDIDGNDVNPLIDDKFKTRLAETITRIEFDYINAKCWEDTEF